MEYSQSKLHTFCSPLIKVHSTIRLSDATIIRIVQLTKGRRPYQSLSKRLQSRMCYTQETYYVGCGHWGPRQNIEPCAAAMGRPGLSRGCWNSRGDGINRIKSSCHTCRRRELRAERSPWDDISPEARLKIDKIRRSYPSKEV